MKFFVYFFHYFKNNVILYLKYITSKILVKKFLLFEIIIFYIYFTQQ